MSGDGSSDDGGADWRRLASDRNVSHQVARALWEQARATAPDDPAQAEHAYHVMLDHAEAANITHEPGRETLADATAGKDASSLGPGKWTRVLLEQPKAAGPASPAAKPSAEELRDKLAAAMQAGKHAAAVLKASAPATILEVVRQLRGQQGTGVLQKLVSVASDAIEQVVRQRSAAPAPQSASAENDPSAASDTTAMADTPAVESAAPAAAAAAPPDEPKG